MNWREELRKEAEQLHKENEFYSFSATQIQQDKEYFGRFVVRSWPPNIKKHTRDISI